MVITDNPLTILQCIETHALKSPDHIAILDDESTLTYRELNQKANQLAHYLLELNVQPYTLIALALEPSLELIISLLAILKIGCGYVPIDAKHPAERLKFILEDTNTSALIIQSKWQNKFLNYEAPILLINEIWDKLHSKSLNNPTHHIRPENLAYTIYTSGSTGKPKGVLIEHKSLNNYSEWFSLYTQCQAQDRIDFSSSIIFDMAVTSTIVALSLGLQIVICKEETKKNIADYLCHLIKHKINIIKLTPSYFRVLLEEVIATQPLLPDLRTIVLGGEILYARDCKRWLSIYSKHHIHNEYGPTEATVAVTQFAVNYQNIMHLKTIVPIGKPGLNVKCLIVNRQNQAARVNEIGELYIGGMCLARGYLNQKHLTDEKFVECALDSEHVIRMYKTGDLCQYLEDGNIEFIGRMDDQIKIRGYRIEPSEIESCLNAHPQVKDSAIIVHKNSTGEAQLYAYYIPRDIKPIKDELLNYLKQHITDYMMPLNLIPMSNLPLTENGKLDKKAFPQPTYDNSKTLPQNSIEAQLINIWKKEFHLEDIGVNSHFFEMGGHSLIAIRIVSELQRKFDKSISLKDIYQFPTISQLAKVICITHDRRQVSEANLLAYSNSKHIPLSDFQFTFWMSNLFEPKVKKLNIIARRRLRGSLNVEALNLAVKWILQKHEILVSAVGKNFPYLSLNKHSVYKITEKDLSHYPNERLEARLLSSLNKLINTRRWKKNIPLLAVKLFKLKDGCSEIQISVSHMVFDDASEEVLFADLSKAYLHIINEMPLPPIHPVQQYKNYIFHEKKHLNQNLKKDIQFWRGYLRDTSLITLPKNEVIHEMGNESYSTYLDLPDNFIKNALQICSSASISITDLFCAAITLSLKKTASEDNNSIFINIIRSIRENDIQDHMIGCFLRLDPIKVDLKTNLELVDLAKSIQQDRVNLEPYQACSGMIKLACLNKTYRRNFIKNTMIHLFANLYSKLFPKLKLNATMIVMYSRLRALRTKHQFLININLLNNFISQKDDTTLFGHDIEKVETYKYDLSKIDNVLDICLLRNNSINKNYLVISGNLNASYRLLIAENIVNQIITSDSKSCFSSSKMCAKTEVLEP